MIYNNIPRLLGDYKLEEGSGAFIKNSAAGILSNIILNHPSSDPTWQTVFSQYSFLLSKLIQGGGLNFLTNTQYIDLPQYTITSDDMLTTTFALALYIKITQLPPTGTVPIFTYSTAGVSIIDNDSSQLSFSQPSSTRKFGLDVRSTGYYRVRLDSCQVI